jgi:hypothetical protein
VTVAFISHCFIYGGMETLISRMASWLLDHGHQVLLIVEKDAPGREFVDQRVVWVILGSDFEGLKWRSRDYCACVVRRHLGERTIDFLIAGTPVSLLVAAGLLHGFRYPATILAGHWTPGLYGHTGLLGLLKDPGSRLFLEELPPQSRLFMSDGLKRQLEKRVGETLDGIVWPLPVDGKRYLGARRRPFRGRIVSVGRLESMKTYNWHAISIVQALVSRGYDVHWDIYGDGDERVALHQKIRELGLKDRIRLRGTIEYAKFAEAVADAQVFVGMGTSAIEAGFCRVPTVCAIAYHPEPAAYGYLHELPDYACGELLDLPLVSTTDLISRVMDLSDSQYALEEMKVFQHVQRFDMGGLMAAFVSHLAQIPKLENVWRPGWLYPVGVLSVRAYQGPLRPIGYLRRWLRAQQAQKLAKWVPKAHP